MSLKIWLPLTKDLYNQGTSGIDAITVGGTIESPGKIGNCYYLSSSSRIYTDLFTPSSNNFSICCWYKAAADNTASGYIMGLSQKTAPSFMVYKEGSTKFRLYGNGSNSSFTHGITVTEWHHLTLTYNGTQCKLYIDGVQKSSRTFSVDFTASNYRIFLNARSNNSSNSGAGSVYGGNNYYNDLRYYDHCLSPLEVKEIAQGLVLHYKLDDDKENQWNYNATIPANNVYSNPTFESSSGWGHWGQSGSSHSSGQNSDKQYIFNKNYSYSHYISEDAGTEKYYYLYQTKDSPGGARSLQCILKEENSTPITSSIVQPTLNSRTGGAAANIWTSIKYLGNGFYYCKYENVIQSQQTGTNALFGIRVYSGYKIYVSEMYLENSETCTSIFSNDIIQDSSGYGHNGTITGTIITNSNTSRYSSSAYISNGVSNYITTPVLQLPGDAITMNFWFKSSNKSPVGNYHMPLESNSAGYYEISISAGGTIRGGLYVNGTRYVDNGTTAKMTDGNWHMGTMTFDGSVIKRYVDGEMEKSTNASGTLNTQQSFIIGHYGTNTSYAISEGYISDVRIYCTPLLDTDIKLLYNNSMRVDNLQNMHTFELVEQGRELLNGIPFTTSYGTHSKTSNLYTPINEEIKLSGTSISLGSDYIQISPTGHTYQYDIIYSCSAGNQFYIGFHRYDAAKTSRSNNACQYVVTTKPTSDVSYVHVKGTVNLATDGTNPTDTISLRVLNGWSGSASDSTKTSTIHYLSLREIATAQKPQIKKNGQFIVDELREYNNAKFYNNSIVETTEIIER